MNPGELIVVRSSRLEGIVVAMDRKGAGELVAALSDYLGGARVGPAPESVKHFTARLRDVVREWDR